MSDPTLIRSVALLVPLIATSALWLWRRPDRRLAAGVMLSCLWNLTALPWVSRLAIELEWWRFDARGAVFLGTPVDLYLGWVLLWGAVAPLAAPRAPLVAVAAAAVALDAWLMRLLAPVLHLSPSWWLGEALAAATALVPGLLVARWTATGVRLFARASLQAACFAAIKAALVPAVVFAMTGDDLAPLLARSAWLNGIAAQGLAVPAIVGLSAVQEFAVRGGGTPIPYDPPVRLVTSGAYAYLANPMQLSVCLLLGGWGAMLGSAWIVAGSAVVLAYGVGLAAWDEGEEMAARFGDPWRAYRAQVHRWIPRLRPYAPHPARLYLDEACALCTGLGRFLERRRPTGLAIVAAQDHPSRDLWRVTYNPGDGTGEEEGVAAVARALEHLHLGWALVAFAMRLPLVRPLVQLFSDALGRGPTPVRRRTATTGSAP